MLTIFTTGKPFRGHIGVIQRNALGSWKHLAGPRDEEDAGLKPGTTGARGAEIEVILFGDEEGAAETARELGVRHEPWVERNEHGTKYLKSLFGRAQEIAKYDILAYVNCDIVLTSAFYSAVQRVTKTLGAKEKFLMVGRRWDADITTPIDFSAADWGERAVRLALETNKQRGPDWIDYFVFSRGLFREIPPLVVGRVGWDNWLVWKARQMGAAVVDASQGVVAVHQNHDYAYHPQGQEGVWNGEEAKRNYELAGGISHIYTIEDATHRLTPEGIEANPGYRWAPARRAWVRTRNRVWHAILGATRPVRHAVGIRRKSGGREVEKLRNQEVGE